MRGRMIAADRTAARMVDLERQRGSDPKCPFLKRPEVDDYVACFLLSVRHVEANAVSTDHTRVADLPAGFAVERRLVEYDRASLPLVQPCNFPAVTHERRHYALDALSLVAEKISGAYLFAHSEPYCLGRSVTRALPRFPRPNSLAFHSGVEACGIDHYATRPERVLRQIERESVGVIQCERRIP